MGKRRIAVANPQVPEVNAIKRELESFVDAITKDTRTVVNEIDGLQAMEVAHLILQKINQNLGIA
jgi:hypothetical protein